MKGTSKSNGPIVSRTIASLPPVWDARRGHIHCDRLQAEANLASNSHSTPTSLAQWQTTAADLRAKLQHKLRIQPIPDALQIEFHQTIPCDGYEIRTLSFCASKDIRVTAHLFVPQGKGPFPAVLNLHGHWLEGKTAARVQARGHILAKNGFVVLTVDSPGAGERCAGNRAEGYHGGFSGASLFLTGDSLLAWQVRDNQRALDVLESFSFVDSSKIGATGASGGGNQTMWLAAMDDRIKAAVPVTSVGSFAAYVTRRNCICETLPNGLALSEEWAILGLIAPRPLLILNSLTDQSGFGVTSYCFTCARLQKIYDLWSATDSFRHKLLDEPHGYGDPMLQAMLGWMNFWLRGTPSNQPQALPEWTALPQEILLCYPHGQCPSSYNFNANRITLADRVLTHKPRSPHETVGELALLVGWKEPGNPAPWIRKKPLKNGLIQAETLSSRAIPIPLVLQEPSSKEPVKKVYLILSNEGKASAFVSREWQHHAHESSVLLSFDFPGVGELKWEEDSVENSTLHDTARACLWLGYSLLGEWAEVIASICIQLNQLYPTAKIEVIAEREAALAALLSSAIRPAPFLHITEHGLPESLTSWLRQNAGSIAAIVPGFLEWGDLTLLRKLATHPPTGDYKTPHRQQIQK